MNNLEFNGLQELTVNEMRDLNGGVVCGGWCIAFLVVVILAASTQPAY